MIVEPLFPEGAQVVHSIPPLSLAERRSEGWHLVPAVGDFPKELTVALPPEIREINGPNAFARVTVTGSALADVNDLAQLDGSRLGPTRSWRRGMRGIAGATAHCCFDGDRHNWNKPVSHELSRFVLIL